MSPVHDTRLPPRHLVLLDVHHAHMQVLRGLAHSRPAQLRLTVVTPAAKLIHPPRVADLVTGASTPAACTLPLAALIARCGARHVAAGVGALNPQARRLTLAQGDTLDYDLLSLDMRPSMDRDSIEDALPGARTHALFYRPVERFVGVWEQLAALRPGRRLHLVVVGGALDAVELALACHHGLNTQAQRPPGSRVSLVTGGPPPGAGEPPALQARVQRALLRRQITVLPERCTGFAPGEVLLANGARLQCDAPVLVLDTQAPPWLRASGLALQASGDVAIQPSLQSLSQPEVFAVERARSPQRGDALLASLRAALADAPPPPAPPPRQKLTLLNCGDGRSLGAWGAWSFEGRWVRALQSRLERRFLRAEAAP